MAASLSKDDFQEPFYPVTDEQKHLYAIFTELKERKNQTMYALAEMQGIKPELIGQFFKKQGSDKRAIELFLEFQRACMDRAMSLPDEISLGDIIVPKRHFAGWHALCSGWDRHQIKYGDLPQPHATSSFLDNMIAYRRPRFQPADCTVPSEASASLPNPLQSRLVRFRYLPGVPTVK